MVPTKWDNIFCHQLLWRILQIHSIDVLQCICKGKDAQVLIKNNHCCLNTMSFIYLISFSFCSHVLAEACSKVVFFIRITKDHIYQIVILGGFFGANQDTEPGPLFNKMAQSYGYRNPHYKPKMVRWPFQVYDGNPYTTETMSSFMHSE